MELKKLWEDLLLWKKCQKEFPDWDGSIVIKKAKKRIREYYKAEAENNDPCIVSVFKDNGDSYIEKIVAPVEGDECEEDVEEWFKECYYRRYYNRGYDCTGQLFTAWYRIFRTATHWIVYQCVAIDC